MDNQDNPIKSGKWRDGYYSNEPYNLENLDEAGMPDESDEPTRTLTDREFSAIEEFGTKWGYYGNSAFSDGVIGILEKVNWTNSDILDFLSEWYISDDQARTDMTDDLLDMLKLGHPEKSEPPYKKVLRDESDKRVDRYFIGQQGQVWIVWHITDIPEGSDDPDYDHLLKENGWGMVASDNTLTMATAHLFLTRDRAYDHIRSASRDSEHFGDTLSHTYELDQM